MLKVIKIVRNRNHSERNVLILERMAAKILIATVIIGQNTRSPYYDLSQLPTLFYIIALLCV